MNKRKLGADYEKIASDFLENRGYQILERNYRCRSGEIDLIARQGEYLCFVEVKYRSGNSCGTPLEAVGYRKQQQIIKVAKYYLMRGQYSMDTACRFDVVAITDKEITLLRNAFGE